MPLLTWNPDFSVKVNHLDDQHVKLVNMINELHDASVRGENKETLERVLYGMRRYVISHFSEEEYYMQKFEYQDYLSHKKEHELFIAQADEFIRDYENGTIAISTDVIEYLVQWLRNHILQVDKKYSACFNEHGLK